MDLAIGYVGTTPQWTTADDHTIIKINIIFALTIMIIFYFTSFIELFKHNIKKTLTLCYLILFRWDA